MNGREGNCRAAVIGVGRMGRHHARIYPQLEGVELVAVVDRDASRAAEVAAGAGCQSFTSVEAMLEAGVEADAVSVATPTKSHLAVASLFLERGVGCLVEKPLATDADQARQLEALAARSGAVLQVGHTERFNPAIRAVEKVEITPRYIEVDRVSPLTFRSLDVGVVMDLMIHDLDIVLSLAGSPVRDVIATGVRAVWEHEDVANARIVFESGCVANLTASRLAFKTERKLRLFAEQAYVSIDYQAREGVIVRLHDQAVLLKKVQSALMAGQDLSDLNYREMVQIEKLTMDPAGGPADPLTAELTAFVRSVRTGEPPAVDAAAGVAAVETAQRVIQAAQAHRWGEDPRSDKSPAAGGGE